MRKYRVTVADGTKMLLLKDWVDFWLLDNKYFKSYRKPDGTRIKLATHWILAIEEEGD